MIKLELPPKPALLTKELQAELTQRYIANGDSVWNIHWLREAVASKAFGKCCYSEIMLNEESKYMEIDHFLPKSKYPNLVMDWENLLPSCKKCNTSKNDNSDVKIINPFTDNPQDFLYFKAYRYCGKDKNGLGKDTAQILDLNNTRHFVLKRCAIGSEIMNTLDSILENIELFESTAIKKHNHLKRLKNLMQKGDRKEEYAALISTTILESEDYQVLEKYLQENSLWDAEFVALKSELEYCALLPPCR